MFEHKIDQREEGKRLDKIVLGFVDKSRSQIKRIIDEGNILVNEEIKKPGYKVKKGDIVKVDYEKALQNDTMLEESLAPEPLELNIVYEDENIIIVNKPKGMVVHPAPGNVSGTLVNALLNYTDKLSNLGGKFRPGIVHRLDKDTSGIMLIAKNDTTHAYFKEKFKSREINKDYLTLCYGDFPEEKALIDAPIGRHPVDRKRMSITGEGRESITKIKILSKFYINNNTISYLKVTPITGRTHQIRVHLSHLGYPIIGDEIYKGRKDINLNEIKFISGQVLHAFKLRFYHPYKKKEVVFRTPLPFDMMNLVRRLNRINK
ncbi:RluA family pseudouridine synthase [Natranaerofaba carboxydovora]|uniref:RluA family pseudouridine synthase n=1 Tax=Natranaerofaba carboxydovora TaxID=2742683 RepID=UPI001F12BEE9|nr:RluA family pseudouridine synthase [Natranaerofaba carboxydovora]UMZ73286.1 Ribosomal large subunit pseudouridine synthase D [Natranaerofaba carboxydovora]